ncbi:MAG: hypothetical protein E6X17_17995 [Sporomusaceae bacterium]|nr:hypothetical protein [Sporomusaceae bacterium]
MELLRRFFAESARLIGRVYAGSNAYFSQGCIVRSRDGAITVENSSQILENGVIVGERAHPVFVGKKTVFGHKSLLIGAQVGNLCEIGNNSILMPGATVGDMCILGEGTLLKEGMHIPAGSVVLGRPGRIIRALSRTDRDMIVRMRGNDTALPGYRPHLLECPAPKEDNMATLYAYKGKFPAISDSACLFPSAEITGDVQIGDKTIIGAGVKIIGDGHGPVRIGNNVQILENSVLHLLPDTELRIEDHAIIGPGCVIHGCQIGSGTVIEPGAIVCDNSIIGKNSLIKAGSLVKQRSRFPDQVVLDGFPAMIDASATPELKPSWIFCYEEALQLLSGG